MNNGRPALALLYPTQRRLMCRVNATYVEIIWMSYFAPTNRNNSWKEYRPQSMGTIGDGK